MWVFAILVIGAYLLGSIPFGLIISRAVARLDITQAGSGNIGATNVAREVGLRWGVVTLVADTLKGWVPVTVAQHFLPLSAHGAEAFAGIAGLSALLGHQFSIYNRFRGGKGIATALGVFLALSPISCLFSGAVFLGAVLIWGYVSLGSIVAALTLPVWLYILDHSTSLILLSIVMSLLITFLHRANLRRLFQGKERRWSKGGYLSRLSRRSNSSSE
jgi:glycerol-3-phosphate acyltransferase PlsY